VTDELHVYEEGVNAVSQAAYMNPGDPLAVERLMQTAVRYQDLTAVNPQGNRLLVSTYFSGDHIVTEAPWQWSKPYSYLILHPGLMLVDWNGAPELKHLLLELADGYLAHGRQDDQGRWTYPTEINWPDGATRGGTRPQQTNLLMWAAYRWTGDAKYLRPIEQTLREGGPAGLSGVINGDIAAALGRPELNQRWIDAAKGANASTMALHGAWATTGDKAYLERLYDELRGEAQFRRPMMTEDHWWVDRVEVPTQELQRQRLGGVALWRNAIVPGHLISWRFADPTDATDLAVLVREPTRTGFRIVAHNLSDRPVAATITGAGVATGRWSLRDGVDADGDDIRDADAAGTTVDFGRDQSLDLVFAPGVATVVDLALEGDEIDIRDRPDLAIADRDVRWAGGALDVTIHSLGSRPAPASQLVLEGADGALLAQATVLPLAAPEDLKAKTTTVRLNPPRDADLIGARVRLTSDDPEITQTNNQAAVPARNR